MSCISKKIPASVCRAPLLAPLNSEGPFNRGVRYSFLFLTADPLASPKRLAMAGWDR
jgi:hypothetical protein